MHSINNMHTMINMRGVDSQTGIRGRGGSVCGMSSATHSQGVLLPVVMGRPTSVSIAMGVGGHGDMGVGGHGDMVCVYNAGMHVYMYIYTHVFVHCCVCTLLHM